MDSGSPNSLIGSHLINFKNNKTYFSGLYSVCGLKINSCGVMEAKITLMRESLTWQFMVIQNLNVDAIIGRDFLHGYKILRFFEAKYYAKSRYSFKY